MSPTGFSPQYRQVAQVGGMAGLVGGGWVEGRGGVRPKGGEWSIYRIIYRVDKMEVPEKRKGGGCIGSKNTEGLDVVRYAMRDRQAHPKSWFPRV